MNEDDHSRPPWHRPLWTMLDHAPGGRADGAVGSSLNVAGMGIEQYVVAAKTQFERLRWIRAQPLDALDHDDYMARMYQTQADVHFYFICWDAILKRVEFVRQKSGLTSPREVMKRHGKVLRHYAMGRKHLEHATERFPHAGPGSPAIVKGPASTGIVSISEGTMTWIWGELHDDTFRIGTTTWDIGPSSLERLVAFVWDWNTSLAAELDTMPYGPARS